MSLSKPKFYGSIAVMDSSLVKEVWYDPAHEILDVKLASGDKYRYREIPSQDFAELITSKSTGRVYNSHIKNCNWDASPRKATKLR